MHNEKKTPPFVLFVRIVQYLHADCKAVQLYMTQNDHSSSTVQDTQLHHALHEDSERFLAKFLLLGNKLKLPSLPSLQLLS